ncbi:MAG: winged helix-turn-helix domain-containing protein [Caldilineales bacterium]|nr:winged helix-turn-helix domain-containing protein [Caldilineales bacterium]
MICITPTQARRLAVAKQRLAAPGLNSPPPPADAAGILDLCRGLGCVQIDPIQAVERTQYLTLWSRLGPFDRRALDHLIFSEKKLFEYWAHAASIVLTENYPIHRNQAQRWRENIAAGGSNDWERRVSAWFQANAPFREYVLAEMRQHGPRALSDLEDRSQENWVSSGWSHGRRVATMVQMLWETGEVMVAARAGSQKKWALAEQWLPEHTAQPPLPPAETTRRAILIALPALGVATVKQIRNHFTRGFYPEWEAVWPRLLAAGVIQPVEVAGWPGEWFILAEDLDTLAQIEVGWQPRTTLLSPFDNLIADRERTEQMWDFRYRIEIYVPPARREYGYYVLPILHGDRLIGRIDPKMQRKTRTLHVQALYAEADAPPAAGPAVAAALADLAAWLGAAAVVYEAPPPAIWRDAF